MEQSTTTLLIVGLRPGHLDQEGTAVPT